jgi:hypothetical protein
MKRAWRAAASAATIMAALSACSSSGDLSAPTGVSSASSTSTNVATSTALVTTTTATRTTATSTSSTALATSTTIDTEAQVKAGYLTLYDAYWTCLRTPQSCDPAALTASVGPARAALTKTVNDLVAGGLFAGPDDPGYVVVESVKLSGPTTAVVSSCWWDTGVLYGPPANAGGDPVVVNNLQVTSRFDTTMELEGGRWLTSEEKRTDRVEGQNKWPPEG